MPHRDITDPADAIVQPASLNRRHAVQAAIGAGAVIAATSAVGSGPRVEHAAAQEVDGTRARTWDEAENINTDIKLEGDGWVTLNTEFPFWALGFAWDNAVGSWPAVEFAVSYDAEVWDEGLWLTIHDDGGPAPKDDRLHTELFFADGQEYIRYRTVDGEGNLVVLDRFQVTYIDPTDGPWEPDRGVTMMRTTAVNDDTLVPPTIITRAQWGANENLRFDSNGEIWPPEYQTVEHAIIHHAAANYGSDGYNAVRSIYYYHCVTQGWGDIGYNYVVDVNGNIFEGRVGGANVIGGHAFEYANGSSGICMMGDFTSTDPPYASKVAMANIVAYVVRDLNPKGTAPFHAAPALPTICGHRDVNQSGCPGDGLYDDLPWIRNQVVSILDSGKLDSQKPGGIVPGDWVRIQTENNTALPMRSQPGMSQLVVDSIPYNTRVEVERGPLADSQYNWYLVLYNKKQGWVPADYLVVDPPIDEPIDGYSYGQNLRMTATTAVKASPSTSSGTVGTASSGSWAFIMAGPLTKSGVVWFQIRHQTAGDGWVPRTTITLAPVYNPTPKFPVGSSVVTTVTAQMRVRPGIAQTVDGNVAAGRTFQVSIAPIAVTGRTWYGVYGGTGTGGGWIEEGQLRAGANSVTVVGNVTASGQQFRTTDSVNLRSGSGTGYSIVTTLSSGVMGSVIGGPQSANGYTWWQVRTDANQQGWLAANYIQQVRTGSTGNLTGYGVGVTVRTNTTVNLRSDAGTGYSIVVELPSNTNGTIIDGPRISTGYTWWKIRTVSNQVGWVAQTYLVRTSGLPPKLTIGKNAINTSPLNFRKTPSASGTLIKRMPTGTVGKVLAGPTKADKYVWWKLQTPYGTGWSTEGFLQTTTKPVPKFGIDMRVEVSGAPLNFRKTPAASGTLIKRMPIGTVGQVLDGPVTADRYTWYKLKTPYGTGWSTDGFLKSTTKPVPKFGVDMRVEVFDAPLNFRDAPAASGTLIKRMPIGTVGQVLDGPVTADRYTWYKLKTAYGTGWCTDGFLQTTTKPLP